MKWKEIISDYLSFTRKERVGVFIILFIIVLAIFLPLFFSTPDLSATHTADSAWIAAAKSLEIKNVKEEKDFGDRQSSLHSYQYDYRKESYSKTPTKAGLFYFDPNTLSTEGWEKLGLPGKTIQTIQNYLAKGGVFRKSEDLKRIYSLPDEVYDRIAPYIRIEQNFPGSKVYYIDEHNRKPSPGIYKNEARPYQKVDINISDTSALIQLPGIGSKLASRIISFRDKLGGFYKIDQVSETFGLPDSTFQKIRPYLVLETALIRQININTAPVEELKTHPYIKFNIANAIVIYRNERGPFEKLEDLKKIMIISEDAFEKMSPYLTLH